jgi:hypothetical protein
MTDQPRSWWQRWLFRPVTPGAARAVVTLFVLSFLLSGAAYWLAVRAVDGQVRSRASVVQLCQAGNESRAQQVTLWTHLVAISTPPPHQTPAQKRQRAAQIASFLAYVRTVFAPRNCATSFKG